jgi:signal transduction histidine kinase
VQTQLEQMQLELAAEVARRTAAEQLCERMTRLSLRAREDEQRRIARDLHDHVGQALTVLKMAIAAGKRAIAQTETAIARLGDAESACSELEQGLAEVAERLRPTVLDALGLRAAIEQHVAAWSERVGIVADLEMWGLEDCRFSEDVETALFRLVQEALTNVSRHAKASQVHVVVQCTAQHAVLSIEDDGVGFDPEIVPVGHFGLVGMRERVSLCRGTLEIESFPGLGSTILARIPRNPEP